MTAMKDMRKLELYAAVSKNEEYGDGMKPIEGKIGMMCSIDPCS